MKNFPESGMFLWLRLLGGLPGRRPKRLCSGSAGRRVAGAAMKMDS